MKVICYFLLIATLGACVIMNEKHRMGDKYLLLSPGNSKDSVITILGLPQNKQFRENIEVWQYCENAVNGRGGKFRENGYWDLWFEDDVLKTIDYYNGYQYQYDCERNFRSVDWDDAP